MIQLTSPPNRVPWPLVVVMISWLLLLLDLIREAFSEPRISRIPVMLAVACVLWGLWMRYRIAWGAVVVVTAFVLGMATVFAIDSGSRPMIQQLFRWTSVVFQVLLLVALQARQTIAWFGLASAARLRLIFWVTVGFVALGSAVLFASRSSGQ